MICSIFRTFRRRAVSLPVGSWICLCLLAEPACAAENPPPQAPASGVRTVVVTEITEVITLDGQLDEPVWQTAPRIGGLLQRQPNPGQPPTEATEVILLRDAEHLYIGVIAHDSEPDRVIGTEMARDASLRSDDRVEILLDTFSNLRNAFYFATNPAGALVDGLTFGNQELNTDWNAIWDVRTQRTDQGWTAEFAIPFKSLNFPKGKSDWGFNISRTIYRKLEEDVWSGARLETEFRQVSEAGKISNLEGINQGIGLDVRPFVAGSWLRTRAAGDNDFDFEPGLDAFYNITPSLKLTGTVNTDFGETEVDARQINLTRFSLFFPEKRSFFLEDVGVFNFASTEPSPPGGIPRAGGELIPFFSRRIGLLDGQEVPINVGGKLTGKVGRTELGILDVHTRDTSFVEDKNFIVGRVKQNLLEQSYVGGIFTHGAPASGESGMTYGLDGRLATSHLFGGDRNFTLDAYGLKSDNEGTSGEDASYGLSARYPNDKYDGMLVFREIQENFDPSLGFVQRRNVRMYRFGASYNPRPKDFLNIQQMFHDMYYTRFDRLDNGRLESSELYITPVDWHFNSGDSIHAIADYARGFERLFEPFEISPGVILPAGDYPTDRLRAVLATARKRPLSGSVSVSYGDFWSGSAEQVSASLEYKIPPYVTLSLRSDQTFAHLPEGDFDARIHTSTINFAVSPRLTFSNLVQYDNRSRNLGWQSRMRWTLKPGNDLFLSFHQGWINEEPGNLRFTAQDTKLSAKFQYTFRF